MTREPELNTPSLMLNEVDSLPPYFCPLTVSLRTRFDFSNWLSIVQE